MNHASFPFTDDLPPNLSEADLLEWIEADTRARAAAEPGSSLARVSQAIRTDRRLGDTLEAMRVDRAALGSLESPAPPQWVTQAVLEEHERQALLALSDMAAAGHRAAEREGEAFTFSAMPRWFKPAMAVAAFLALAFGAWQLYPVVFPARPILPDPQPVAANTDPRPDPSPERETPAPPALAVTPSVVPAEVLRPLEPRPADVLAARLDMPLDRAFELAMAGRLVLVVDVDDARALQEAAEAVVARPVDESWRLQEAQHELLAAMASPHHARLIGTPGAGEDTVVVGDRGPLGQLEYVLAATPTVYVAHASASPSALLGLLDGLGHMGRSVRVVVVDEPLPGTGAAPAPTAASALLWWDSDPALWQPWAAIPVRFIESR
jgi:hypothetical protein